MKALQLEQPLHWKRIDIAEPPKPGPGEVLLRVHRIGICGTDLGGYLGKMPFFSYPRVPGHELGVEVIATGPDVSNVQVGDRCSVEPYINCGHCYSCRRGFTNCCETNKTLGVMCDGGMTERILLPARKMHPSKSLSYEQLALVETLAIGCHAIHRGRATTGEAILVIGAGPIGLSVIEFAKLSGARTIVTQGDGAELKQLQELTNGQLADLVVDATGNNKSMAQALNYCAFKGRVVYVGITQSEISIPHAPALHRRELDILASRNALPGDFTRIIQLIEQGRIDTVPWITHHAGFDSMIDVFASWTKPETGVIKAIVEVD